MDKDPDYLSYLLRLWQVRSEGKCVWRASLESPRTGVRQGFASLADLFAFLAQQTVQQEGQWATDDGGRTTADG